MSIVFGVISYLPDNNIRDKRLKAHYTQMEWLSRVLPNIPTVRVYQNWREDKIPNAPTADDIVKMFNVGIGPSRARNIILEYFYASNFDWLMLCDDDSYLYNHYEPEMFLEEISETDKFNYLGIIVPLNPRVTPFKKANYEPAKKGLYVFTRDNLLNEHPVMFIPNITKLGYSSIYFDAEFYEKHNSYEDVLFALRWVYSGHKFYQLESLILKSQELDNSSIYGDRTVSKQNRLKVKDDALRALSQQLNIPLVSRNGSIALDMKAVPNTTHTKYAIPRKRPIEFKESEVPNTSTQRKLF